MSLTIAAGEYSRLVAMRDVDLEAALDDADTVADVASNVGYRPSVVLTAIGRRGLQHRVATTNIDETSRRAQDEQ